MSYPGRSNKTGISLSFPGFPPGVKWLIVANVAVFILGIVTASTIVADFLATLRLVPEAVVRLFAVWELATYLFLHGSFSHILWNMLALWMFGAEIERAWGTRRFLQFYFFCGYRRGRLRSDCKLHRGHSPEPPLSALPERFSASCSPTL